MEDFRTQLTACIDAILAEGSTPVFLVVDLEGAAQIKRTYDLDALDRFRAAASDAVSSAGGGCDTFTYGEERIIAVLAGVDRLKSFSIADKLRRGLPLLGQSFDAILHVEFDFIDYDPATGVAGLINQLVHQQKLKHEDVA
jgi:GGDEF domain-containing protein